MKNHKKAFTLAEVLTTLMVIGIVAALTIPSMMNSYKKHTTVVKLKKAYSQIQEATKRIPLEAGCSAGDFECAGYTNYETTSVEEELDNPSLFTAYVKQFNPSKINLNGDCSEQTPLKNRPCFYTNDGMTIFIMYNQEVILENGENYKRFIPTNIQVDINGDKKPNQLGQDRFGFRFVIQNKNGVQAGTIIPIGSKLDNQYRGTDTMDWQKTCVNEDIGVGCTGRILETGKMDY